MNRAVILAEINKCIRSPISQEAFEAIDQWQYELDTEGIYERATTLYGISKAAVRLVLGYMEAGDEARNAWLGKKTAREVAWMHNHYASMPLTPEAEHKANMLYRYRRYGKYIGVLPLSKATRPEVDDVLALYGIKADSYKELENSLCFAIDGKAHASCPTTGEIIDQITVLRETAAEEEEAQAA